MTNGNYFRSWYVTIEIIFDFNVNKYQTNKYFSKTFFEWLSLTLTLQFAALKSLSMAIFEHRRFHKVVWLCN